MRTDGRTYITKLTLAFTSCFASVPKHFLPLPGLEPRMFSNQKSFFFRCLSTNSNICPSPDTKSGRPCSNLDPEACLCLLLCTVYPKYLGSHHIIIGHNRFLLYPFPFIIHGHSSPYYSKVHNQHS
jgi:hypothetical protein